MKKTNFALVIILAISTIAFNSCAPVFSDLQGARMVGKGNSEFTGSYSSVSFDPQQEGKSAESIQNHIGIQYAYGINEDFDIRARYEWIWLSEKGELSDGVGAIAIGPKYRIYKNYIAAFLPIGKGVGQASEDSWQIHPTMLFTAPVLENKIDINGSIKYLIPFKEKSDNLLAFNLGLALSNDVTKWSVRPEFGILFNPGEDGYITHFSVGFSGSFGK